MPEPEPFCRSPKSWLRLPYEKTAPPHSFHAGSALTTCIVWCGSTAGAGARAVQEPHQTGPYSAGGKLAWLSLTAVTCVGLITQGVSFSVTLITLPLTFSTSPWRWIAFLFGYPDPFSRGWPQASRAVCVTKNETLKFVNIARSNGMLSGESEPGSSFTITISTLHHGYNNMWWVTDTTIIPSGEHG